MPGARVHRLPRRGRPKKLELVAETWARGDQPVTEGPIEALREMGASPATIEQARIKLGLDEPSQGIPVLPENWHAVQAFSAMATQWHWRPTKAGGAAREGLRLEALPTVLAGLRQGLHRRPLADLLPRLQVMERAALLVFNRSN